MTKEMAKELIVAQASSDVGKNIPDLYDRLVIKLQDRACCGYYGKDRAIFNLINLLARYPQRDVHFYVCADEDRVAKYLVYFDFMLDGQKVQVSFHSFDRRLKAFLSGSRRSHTDWKSELVSREVCFALARKMGYLRY